MSLYNMMFGRNPSAPLLLGMLGLTDGEVGRFRDAWLEHADAGFVIVIHTRNGGGNREDYQCVFDVLSLHPQYLSDADDDFDCTYADIRFSVPPQFQAAAEALLQRDGDTTPPAEKWRVLLEKLRTADESDPVVKHAMDVMRPTMEKIGEFLKKGTCS